MSDYSVRNILYSILSMHTQLLDATQANPVPLMLSLLSSKFCKHGIYDEYWHEQVLISE